MRGRKFQGGFTARKFCYISIGGSNFPFPRTGVLVCCQSVNGNYFNSD